MDTAAIQKISLFQELDLAVEAAKSGLALIQSIEPGKVPVFLAFLVLSTSLERILKIILGMRLLTDEGRFLTKDELQKQYGHNVRKLTEAVLEKCFDGEKTSPPIRKDDYCYLKSNDLLNAILAHLSEFAVRDRYVYMNGIIEPSSLGKWLGTRWQEIEQIIIPCEEAVAYLGEAQQEKYTARISSELVVCIEQFIGALGRCVTYGEMNSDAKSAGTVLYSFVMLRKEQLGTTKYELFGHGPI